MAEETFRETLATFWDDHTARWLAGETAMPEPLPDWFASYRGAAERDGLAEPYIGDLRGTPRMVLLGLHAGEYFPAFQAVDGVFANEIREYGSYSEWAASGPYLREPWTSSIGPNRFQRACLSFTRRWLVKPNATHADMLVFEMYPWHFTQQKAELDPLAAVIDEFVWRPISELPTRWVFAFGSAWNGLARRLALPMTDSLGMGGRLYGSNVRSRAVRVYALPSGQTLVVEWHQGAVSPPSAEEVVLLRAALAGGR